MDRANERTDASLIGLRRLSGVGTSRSIGTVSTRSGAAFLAFVLGMFVISMDENTPIPTSDRAVASWRLGDYGTLDGVRATPEPGAVM